MNTPSNMTRRQFVGSAVATATCMALPSLCWGDDLSESGKLAVPELKAIPFTNVTVTGAFWKTRLEINRKVTIPHCFHEIERVGLIDNFARAAGLMPADTYQEGKHDIPGRECDLYKVIEGASYALQKQPDKELDRYLDGVIAKIAAAQESDGYLYPTRRFLPPDKMGRGGPRRWENEIRSQELYINGHLYEAAVAHYQATGKRALLDVAIKNADLVCNIFGFGPNQRACPSGHQEIEPALVRLYRATGNEKYLTQAQFFIDVRGRADTHTLYGKHSLDHMPVVEQQHAEGHCVKAAYMFTSMADLVMHADRQDYLKPLDRFWRDVVGSKLYIIGGVGVADRNEMYGDAYELPNDKAYCETCAAIAHAMWAHRMFLLHGDAAYLDLVERVIYNNLLAGISLAGNTFWYTNTLERSAKHKGDKRWSWHFKSPCCPTNIVRFMPSLAGYAYAQKDAALYVNQFGGSEVRTSVNGVNVRLIQEGEYPWDGNVTIRVEIDHPMNCAIHIRIPGWARNQAFPSDLYRFDRTDSAGAKLAVNGQTLNRPDMEKGFAVIHRAWKTGDTIQLELPMPVRRVLSHERVIANRGKVAIQRGPIVYCVEDVDNARNVANLSLPNDAPFNVERSDILGGIMQVRTSAKAAGKPQELTAIPYYAWSNRDQGEMRVWLPTAD
jgi:uncharacterized protein